MPNSTPSGSVQVLSQVGSTTIRTLSASDITDPTAQFYWDPAQGGNGHIYEYVDYAKYLRSVGYNNDDINSFINNLTGDEGYRGYGASIISGVSGYLVTITSASEQAFVADHIGDMTAWIGLSPGTSTLSGNAEWMTGPETGQAASYQNWAEGEPGFNPWAIFTIMVGNNNFGQSGKWYGNTTQFMFGSTDYKSQPVTGFGGYAGGRGRNISYFSNLNLFADDGFKSYVSGSYVFSLSNDAPVISWQWQRSNDGGGNWVDIAGATEETYAVSSSDLYNFIRLKSVVTGRQYIDNPEFGFEPSINDIAEEIYSPESLILNPPTGYIYEFPDRAEFTTPGIVADGKAFTQGRTIYADASQITDADGLGTVSWQWQRSLDKGATWADIGGATTSSYTLIENDVASQVRSEASYVDGLGNHETVYSSASSGVLSVITSNGGGASATLSIAENSTTVTTVTATDVDAGATLTYSLAGGADAAMFQINATTGALSLKVAPNFEAAADAGANNVYDVIVQVADGSLTDTQAIAVTVTNANEAPLITSNGGVASANVSTAENSKAFTTVKASDVDSGTTLSYSISGGADAALFSINATTGALSFKFAPNFEVLKDAGANNVYDVIVQVSDGSLTDTQALAVTVTNANEAPALTSNGGGATGTASIAENSTAVTTVKASDVDAGTTLAYSLAGGADAAMFQINATTGALSFKSAPSFEAARDVGKDNVYDVVVQVSDGSLTDRQAITITVQDIANEFLVGTSKSDKLTGAGGNDTLKGSGGNDKLYGSLGNDILDGGTGADRMEGGAGNDIYTVDNAGDVVVETTGSGRDTVKASVSYALGANVENLTLTGSANLGGRGNDLANTIIGNAGANILMGFGGNDVIKGGSGSDTLYGGTGKDVLTGGTGQDFFVFDTAANAANVDKITDFNFGDNDKIQLSKAVFEGITHLGSLTTGEFYAAAGATKARDSTDRVIYDTASGKLYYDVDGFGGAAAVQIAVLGSAPHPVPIYSDIQIVA